MPQYHFDCQRSADPADQIDGVACSAATVGGEYPADNANDAWKFAESMCFIPGTWTIKMRNGRRRLKPRKVVVEFAKAN